MKSHFVSSLSVQAQIRDEILLIVGDLGYSIVEQFEEQFPNRFLNAGIAEQGMMGIASGLAIEGFRPFVYSIGNFSTFRCAEQIRNDVAFHKLPVTIVSVGGGLVYGSAGYSHHAIQDYALMRSLPGMTIYAPGDLLELEYCLQQILESTSPAYLRLGSWSGDKLSHSLNTAQIRENVRFVAGISQSRKVLLSTGATLGLACEWLSEEKYQGYAVYSIPIWGPEQREQIADFIEGKETIVTLEDHLVDGGFGSWILETTNFSSNEHSPKIQIKGLRSAVSELVGDQQTLRWLGGLVP